MSERLEDEMLVINRQTDRQIMSIYIAHRRRKTSNALSSKVLYKFTYLYLYVYLLVIVVCR